MYTLNKKDLIWLDCNEIHKESEILVCIGLSTSILSSIGDIELLGNEGSDRFRALRNECNRRDFVAARVLAKYVASKMTGSSLSDIFIKQFCCGCNQEGHGKPFFFSHPDLHVSWSHQNGVVMVAVAAFPIGVDIETIHSMPVEVDFAKNVLSEEELRFFDAI
jgi:4'-phosphopantetheinyl transferase